MNFLKQTIRVNTFYIWLFLMILCLNTEAQDILVDNRSQISFFSSAILEDIKASSNRASSALNIKTNEIVFKIAIRSFEFKKKLMQQHFNENYLESDKYPYSTFVGKITDTVDLKRVGKYQVMVTGNLEIHGVKKNYIAQVDIEVKKDHINAQTRFNVRLADHKIKIPRVVIKNIAEEVEVKVASTYQLE